MDSAAEVDSCIQWMSCQRDSDIAEYEAIEQELRNARAATAIQYAFKIYMVKKRTIHE